MPRESGASSTPRNKHVGRPRPRQSAVAPGSSAFADDDGNDWRLPRGNGRLLPVTIALPAQPERRLFRFDISWPILIAFAAVLCVLIVLPMSWLVFFSVTHRGGAFTFAHFPQLITHPTFVDPPITTLIRATNS